MGVMIAIFTLLIGLGILCQTLAGVRGQKETLIEASRAFYLLAMLDLCFLIMIWLGPV